MGICHPCYLQLGFELLKPHLGALSQHTGQQGCKQAALSVGSHTACFIFVLQTSAKEKARRDVSLGER